MLEPFELPIDEQRWETFAAKHVPLPVELVAELLGRGVFAGGPISCTQCGARSKAVCACGAPYLSQHKWIVPPEEPVPAPPNALDRAMAAVKAQPEKSNRELAAEIGVGHQTVGRARKRLQAIGKDGPPLDHD
jgi:hypothetical protein